MKGRFFVRVRSTVFLSWLLCFLFIFLVPMSTSGIVYMNAVASMRREMERVHQAELEKFRHLMDGQMAEMSRVAMELSLDYELISLCAVKNIQPKDHLFLFRLQKRLRDYSISNAAITEISILFFNSDRTITNSGAFTNEGYNEVVFGGRMKEVFQTGEYVNRFTVYPMREQTMVVYILSLPLQLDSAHSAFAVVSMQNAVLRQIGQGLVGRNIVLHFGLEEILIGQPLSTDSYTSMWMDSSLADIRYEYRIDNSGWNEAVVTITGITVLALALCLFLCITILVLFMKRNYNPILRILNRLGGSFGPTGFVNELEYIENSISDTLAKADRLKLELDKTTDAAKELFILRLLAGNIGRTDIEAAGNWLPSGGVYFVATVQPIAYGNFFFTARNDDDNLYLTQSIIKNIMADCAETGAFVYSVTIGGNISTVFHTDRSQVSDILCQIGRMPDALRTLFNVTVCIGTGSETYRAEDLAKSYHQARDMLEYCLMFNKDFSPYRASNNNSLTHFRDIEKSLEISRRFRNAVVGMDFGGAIALLDEIFDLFFNHDQKMEDIRMGLYSITSLTQTALKECAVRHPNSGIMINELEKKLSHSISIYDLKASILYILSELEKTRVEMGDQQVNMISQRVTRYIEENYHRNDLSVAAIAAHFKFSTSYLSKVFKKNGGAGVLDCIHRVRITQAKLLIRKGTFTIAQIAQKIGYTDANSFIRTFKKYEGVSPGKY